MENTVSMMIEKVEEYRAVKNTADIKESALRGAA
jgi:hypothetical protein